MGMVTLTSPVTGGGGINLPVLDALLLRIWVDEGSDEIVARAYEILQKSSSLVRVDKKYIPATDVTWGMLCSVLAGLQHRRGQNLARLGVIEVESPLG